MRDWSIGRRSGDEAQLCRVKQQEDELSSWKFPYSTMLLEIIDRLYKVKNERRPRSPQIDSKPSVHRLQQVFWLTEYLSFQLSPPSDNTWCSRDVFSESEIFFGPILRSSAFFGWQRIHRVVDRFGTIGCPESLLHRRRASYISI